MKWLFPLLIFLSLFFGMLTGNMEAVSKAALESAAEAVKLVFLLMSTVCLWSGMMKVAAASGITTYLVRILSPLLNLIFGKKLPEKAKQAIAMNISANLLGLGNAATPFGLTAMQELQGIKSEASDTASDEMVLFTVINTSSVQLIPTTVVGLRLACGSETPMDILPAVWIVSLITLTISVLAAKILSRIFH